MTRHPSKLGRTVAGLALALCGNGAAQPTALPAYSPGAITGGVIRSWGDRAMRPTMTAWEQAFRKYHPEISFQDDLLGTATSMAGIITNSSDLSLMGRSASVNEIIGFEWVFRVKPLGIQVMNGGLQAEGSSPALAVFVSHDNPLQQIGMAQLAAMLGCPVDSKQPVTWAAAGVTGKWASRPVHVYLYDDQTGTGGFLQRAIQGSKDCWNWDIVREFRDRMHDKNLPSPAAQQIVDALRRDPDGLAVATLAYANPQVKALPVAGSGPAVSLTAATVTDGTYPLGRGVYIYINRAADKPVDQNIREFLRFILSDEGQELVRRQGDFLRLNAVVAAEQRRKLE